MTGKQLKNSILQWAIQGKLVPQDPNDEPASILLEKIRAEKARLIKEGKIKKDKKASVIYRGEDNSYYEKFADGKVVCIDEEIPFEIQQGWEWCRLNAITNISGGKRIPVGEKLTKTDTGHKYIRVTDMKNHSIMNNDIHYISEIIYQKIKAYYITKNDLYITVAGTIGHVGEVPTDFDGANLTENANKIVLFCLNKRFLLYMLSSNWVQSQIKGCTTKVGQPKLAIFRVKNLIVPIPPLAEQKRIVAKIEELMPLVAHYDNARRELDKLNFNVGKLLKKSILQEAIQGKLVPQDPNDEPVTHLLQRIKEEKQKLVKEGKLKKKDAIDSVIFKGNDNKYYEQIDGIAIQIESDYDFPNTWEVVRLSHICRLIDGEKKEGQYVCLDAKYLRGKSTGAQLNKGKFVIKGDNIILVDGENSGEVFAVPHDGYMGSTFKQLWVSEAMHLPYVLYFIQFYKDLLRNSKKGAAIPHLNKEIFYSLVIGIPPYQEQIRIARKIDIILNEIKG